MFSSLNPNIEHPSENLVNGQKKSKQKQNIANSEQKKDEAFAFLPKMSLIIDKNKNFKIKKLRE